MKCLVMTKNFFHAPRGLAAMLRGDRENKAVRENLHVKMFAVAGYHTVVCDAFILNFHISTTAGQKHLIFDILSHHSISFYSVLLFSRVSPGVGLGIKN